MNKTYKTAVVIIPPEELWMPIQKIRRQYDRHFQRWMPHINLIYPFRLREQFTSLEPRFREVAQRLLPFTCSLAKFKYFIRKRQSFTVWLFPEPLNPIRELQQQFQKIVPECDDVNRFKGGFTPHLSVGQVHGRSALNRLIENLQKDWKPLSFTVDRIYFIVREDPPHDVFKIAVEIPFGTG